MENHLHMQRRPAPPIAGPEWRPLPADERQNPAVRRKLSAPALRAFFNIARAWQLSVTEERGLLGWPPPSTFHKYKSGDAGVLSFDTLTRVSLVLGIYKALHILYPEPLFADRWMTMPNSNRLFGGRTPLAFCVDAGIDGLFQVRRLLDGRRGWPPSTPLTARPSTRGAHCRLRASVGRMPAGWCQAAIHRSGSSTRLPRRATWKAFRSSR